MTRYIVLAGSVAFAALAVVGIISVIEFIAGLVAFCLGYELSRLYRNKNN